MDRFANISGAFGIVLHALQMSPQGEDEQEEHCQGHSEGDECEHSVHEYNVPRNLRIITWYGTEGSICFNSVIEDMNMCVCN